MCVSYEMFQNLSFNAQVALKRKTTQFFDVQRSHDIYFRKGVNQGIVSNDIAKRTRHNPNNQDLIHEFIKATGGTDIGPYYVALSSFSLELESEIPNSFLLNYNTLTETIPVTYDLAYAFNETLPTTVTTFVTTLTKITDWLQLPFEITQQLNQKLDSLYQGPDAVATVPPSEYNYFFFDSTTGTFSLQVVSTFQSYITYPLRLSTTTTTSTQSVWSFFNVGQNLFNTSTTVASSMVAFSISQEIGNCFMRNLETKGPNILANQQANVNLNVGNAAATYQGTAFLQETPLPTDLNYGNFYVEYAQMARMLPPEACLLLDSDNSFNKEKSFFNLNILTNIRQDNITDLWNSRIFGIPFSCTSLGTNVVLPDSRSLANNVTQTPRNNTYGAVAPCFTNLNCGIYVTQDIFSPVLYGNILGAPFLGDLKQKIAFTNAVSETVKNFLKLDNLNLSGEYPLYTVTSPLRAAINLQNWSNLYNSSPLGYSTSAVVNALKYELTNFFTQTTATPVAVDKCNYSDNIFNQLTTQDFNATPAMEHFLQVSTDYRLNSNFLYWGQNFSQMTQGMIGTYVMGLVQNPFTFTAPFVCRRWQYLLNNFSAPGVVETVPLFKYLNGGTDLGSFYLEGINCTDSPQWNGIVQPISGQTCYRLFTLEYVEDALMTAQYNTSLVQNSKNIFWQSTNFNMNYDYISYQIGSVSPYYTYGVRSVSPSSIIVNFANTQATASTFTNYDQAQWKYVGSPAYLTSPVTILPSYTAVDPSVSLPAGIPIRTVDFASLTGTGPLNINGQNYPQSTNNVFTFPPDNLVSDLSMSAWSSLYVASREDALSLSSGTNSTGGLANPTNNSGLFIGNICGTTICNTGSTSSFSLHKQITNFPVNTTKIFAIFVSDSPIYVPDEYFGLKGNYTYARAGLPLSGQSSASSAFYNQAYLPVNGNITANSVPTPKSPYDSDFTGSSTMASNNTFYVSSYTNASVNYDKFSYEVSLQQTNDALVNTIPSTYYPSMLSSHGVYTNQIFTKAYAGNSQYNPLQDYLLPKMHTGQFHMNLMLLEANVSTPNAFPTDFDFHYQIIGSRLNNSLWKNTVNTNTPFKFQIPTVGNRGCYNSSTAYNTAITGTNIANVPFEINGLDLGSLRSVHTPNIIMSEEVNPQSTSFEVGDLFQSYNPAPTILALQDPDNLIKNNFMNQSGIFTQWLRVYNFTKTLVDGHFATVGDNAVTRLIPLTISCEQIPTDSGVNIPVLATKSISAVFTNYPPTTPTETTPLIDWLYGTSKIDARIADQEPVDRHYYALIKSYPYKDPSNGWLGLTFNIWLGQRKLTIPEIVSYEFHCNFAQKGEDDVRVAKERGEYGDRHAW